MLKKTKGLTKQIRKYFNNLDFNQPSVEELDSINSKVNTYIENVKDIKLKLAAMKKFRSTLASEEDEASEEDDEEEPQEEAGEQQRPEGIE